MASYGSAQGRMAWTLAVGCVLVAGTAVAGYRVLPPRTDVPYGPVPALARVRGLYG